MNEATFGEFASAYVHFLRMVAARLPRHGLVLDLGSGENALRRYVPAADHGGVRTIALDCRLVSVAKNTSSFRLVGDAESLPIVSNSVDLITASCFFEHVKRPGRILDECGRVLKPGGAMLFYTPNKYSYVATLARITPTSFHRCIRRLQTGMKTCEVEVCRTEYRFNTRRDILRHAHGFSLELLGTYTGAPCYSTFVPPPVHRLFLAVHKLIQRCDWLSRALGECIIGCAIKTQSQPGK